MNVHEWGGVQLGSKSGLKMHSNLSELQSFKCENLVSFLLLNVDLDLLSFADLQVCVWLCEPEWYRNYCVYLFFQYIAPLQVLINGDLFFI